MADADFRGVFHRTAISISYFLAHGEQKGTEIRCACMRMCFTFSLSFFFVVLWNEENGRTLFALVPNMGNDFLKFPGYPLIRPCPQQTILCKMRVGITLVNKMCNLHQFKL